MFKKKKVSNFLLETFLESPSRKLSGLIFSYVPNDMPVLSSRNIVQATNVSHM